MCWNDCPHPELLFRLRPVGLALRVFRLRPVGLALRVFRLRPVGLALRAATFSRWEKAPRAFVSANWDSSVPYSNVSPFAYPGILSSSSSGSGRSFWMSLNCE
jgi:hypothetical protein